MNPASQQEQQKKMGRPRKYSEEFRQEVLERMKTCANVTALARELGIRRKFLYQWRDDALGRSPEPQVGTDPQAKSDSRQNRRIGELERLVAQQALEIDFFKGALLRVEENRRKREQTSGTPSTSKSGK